MGEPSFLTVAEGAARPIAAWSDDLAVLGYHTEDSLPEALAALPRWRFHVPVTQVPLNEVNSRGYPVLDCDHRPLWKGCAIEAGFGSLYTGQTADATFVHADKLEGCQIRTLRPVATYSYDMVIRSRIRVADSADQRVDHMTYERKGLYPSAFRMFETVGNYDLGFSARYIRLKDDPRTVCTRARRPRRRSVAA